MTKPINLKETVNLPQTEFPIRANLAQKEPEILAFWAQNNIYEKLKAQQNTYKNSYILHDGPPYPNGDIHMGHALNKVLKDIVARSKGMQDQKSLYVPGWDCHGLPIETQVIKDLKKNNNESLKHDISAFRERCKEFAMGYVVTQKKEFQSLGIFGEWDTPYLTLNQTYEAGVIALFGQMAENGLIFEGRKPIHWCSECETALAEAEIEYQDHRSPTVFISFKVKQASPKLQAIIKNEPAAVVVWTTTPWTLPANVAIAAHPDFTYLVAKANNQNYIFVKDLKDILSAKLELSNLEIIGKILGKDLLDTSTQHPFLARTSPIVLANYVTKEDGTGFVHIAPGHGYDDYIVGQNYKLPMLMPVDNQGKFTDEVPMLQGIKVWDANKIIGQKMQELGTLLKLEFIKHSYPHCWRCKSPVIFRATEQWFVAMDVPMKNDGKTLREKALTAITKAKWYPAWGEKRINSMISGRPDWCISRQRSWGIPIPVFICKNCEHTEMVGEFNKAIVDLVKKEGVNSWFTKSAKEILPPHLKCGKCGHNDFHKEEDILDVWFESGSSWGAVLNPHPELSSPADLYLEGSDQHRGWFQSSLLVGVGAVNSAPYKAVLTHGFITDEKGRKMSKSEGNVISPLDVIKEYGADILRWWVASTDFKDDISCAKTIFNQARDSFSKTRNTFRFLLSNLSDFNPKTDLVNPEKLQEIDQWILLKLNNLITDVTRAYNKFEFHLITYKIHDFCAVTLSALYLDMVKDTLYCGAKNGDDRKSSQTAIYYILDTLLKLSAPIIVFSAEDAYKYFNKLEKKESVHLEILPQINPAFAKADLETKWEKILKIKDFVYQKLEVLRNNKEIKSFLEAEILLTLPEAMGFSDWTKVFIVSKVTVEAGSALSAEVKKASGDKCERCWKYNQLTESLCPRCLSVIKP